MSRHTICRLTDAASAAGCVREEDILLPNAKNRRFQNSPELGLVEKCLFRFGGGNTLEQDSCGRNTSENVFL